jgi:glycosyltransferase involved in cell wall biosynthesis
MRSVVLATYQGGPYIGEQLDSILSQLAPDDEIIVSDDASTDATLTLVRDWQSRDARIKLLANDRRAGYVGNFTRAIAHSNGDLVYFSDQDDIWLPDKIRAMDAALARHACVATDARVVDATLNPLYRSYFEWRGTKGFSFTSILLKPPIIGATMACQRHYLLSLLPVPDGVPHDFWISLNATWDRCLEVLPQPLILYRRHAAVLSESATDRKRAKGTILQERIRILAAFLGRRLRPGAPSKRLQNT